MNINDKLKELKKIIPIKFRVWSKAGSNFIVMWYIDARDCQDRLDELFWTDRQRTYHDVWWKAYCTVSIWDWTKWISRSDVWDPTAISKNKWEASDSFKRACVNWGLGRFLYTMPKIMISESEEKANKYNITTFVKKKFKNELTERSNKYWLDLDKKSEYSSSDDENTELPDINMEDATDGFTPAK